LQGGDASGCRAQGGGAAGGATRAARVGGGDLLLWGRACGRRPAQGGSAMRAQMGPRAGPQRAERVKSGHRLVPIG
jgi:hypothetical protein